MKKSNWKIVIKIFASGLAIFLVVRQVDLKEISRYMRDVPLSLTIASIGIFNISKILGAVRLNLFFKHEGIRLPEKTNVRLYYKGMFYNLFLPGGIGGDGYKGYLIRKVLKVPVKNIFRSILWDRVSGAAAIGSLSLILGYFVLWQGEFQEIKFLLIVALLVLFPAFYLTTNFLFPQYKSIFLTSFALALIIQILQAFVAIVILLGMDVPLNKMVEYILVFFISSLATILPITIGGIGIRELVFLYAAQHTSVEQHIAVAFSVVFFLITAISSIAGNFIKVTLQQGGESEN